MSTNFYAVKIPSVKEHQEMQQALITKQYDKLRILLDRTNKKYHIGKRSCGWQFLFESCQSGAPWDSDTLDSIRTFLSDPSVTIKNEYGVMFEPKAFWEEEVGKSLYHDPENYINGEDYDKRDSSRLYYYSCKDNEFTNEEGIRFSKSEFC